MIGRKGSLGRRAISAGLWTLVLEFSRSGFRLVSNLVMTRLLLPEAFGMMAMAIAMLGALNLFTDIGINRSIMRDRDGAEPLFLHTAWTVKMVRSTVISAGILVAALGLWLLAPAWAPPDTVYAQPELPGLIALTALSPLLLGLTSTSYELALRRLENRRIGLLTLASQVVSLGAMVLFAQISPTVWALMAGMLTGNVMQALLSHLVLPGPRMRLAWDTGIVARLWSFGKWLLGAGVMTFLARNADRLILGALLNSTGFGIYVIAQLWMEAAQTFLARMGFAVGFPVIAEVLRTRPADVPRLYRKFQTVIDVFCIAAFLGALLLGPWLIGLLYSPAYLVAGHYLQLMAGGFLLARFEPLTNLVLNTGNSGAGMIIASVRAVAICVLLPIGFHFGGVERAILALVLTPALTIPYTLALTRPILGRRQNNADIAIFAIAFAIAVAVPLLT